MRAILCVLVAATAALAPSAQVSRDYAQARSTLAQERQLVLSAVATRPAWSRADVRAGARYLFSGAARYADAARALLARQEVAIQATTPSSPAEAFPLAVPHTTGPPLAYVESGPFRGWRDWQVLAAPRGRLEAFEAALDELVGTALQLYGDIPTGPIPRSHAAAELVAIADAVDLFAVRVGGARDAQGVPTASPGLVGGDFEWMRDPTAAELAGAQLAPQKVLWITDHHSAAISTAPSSLSRTTWIGNSEAASWGEHGPKWLKRAYNVRGSIEGMVAWRIGDWHAGREGHDSYVNLLEDFTLERCVSIQCGGQSLQAVWRPSETRIPSSEWKQAQHTLRIVDCTAIDSGALAGWQDSRASWPFAIYNPGQKVEILRLTIRTRLAPFDVKGRTCQSTGALFLGPGGSAPIGSGAFNVYIRCPSALVEDLDVEVWRSDREEVRLWAQDDVHLVRPRIVDHGGEAEISIVDDCGRVRITGARTAIRVRLHRASAPYGAPYKTWLVPVGGSLSWP